MCMHVTSGSWELQAAPGVLNLLSTHAHVLQQAAEGRAG